MIGFFSNHSFRYNLWCSTPSSPSIAFDLRLMETCRVFLMNGRVPLNAFCACLSELNKDTHRVDAEVTYFCLFCFNKVCNAIFHDFVLFLSAASGDADIVVRISVLPSVWSCHRVLVASSISTMITCRVPGHLSEFSDKWPCSNATKLSNSSRKSKNNFTRQNCLKIYFRTVHLIYSIPVFEFLMSWPSSSSCSDREQSEEWSHWLDICAECSHWPEQVTRS